MLIKDMYDKLALNTGFPIYTNETDTPDINRFLLSILDEGLHDVISKVYLCNNVLERKQTIHVMKGTSEYGIDGVIKDIVLYNKTGSTKLKRLDYLYDINPYDEDNRQGVPRGYVIRGGYLKLIDTPEDDYTLKIIVSTTDLVFADNDVARSTIQHINDTVCANEEFCNLIVCSATALLFARCQNAAAPIYAELANKKLKLFLEHDNASHEGLRAYNRQGGHYNMEDGLLGD